MALYFHPDQGEFNFIVLQRIHRNDHDGTKIDFIRTIYVQADSAEQAQQQASDLYSESFEWEHLGTYQLVE